MASTQIGARSLALIGALTLLWHSPVGAQICGPGELRVLVTDSQQRPVPDAQVSIDPGSAQKIAASTPASGIVQFNPVACGRWSVGASKAGFEDSTGIVNITGQTVVDFTLTLNPEIRRDRLDVTDTPPPVEQSSTQNHELRREEVKALPSNPASVADALPLVPGIVRSSEGELKIEGTGEQRSSLIVNQSDVTDPATGKFGQTIPIDSVETVNVLITPFLAQYGRFTQSVVAVKTRRGGEKWHGDINDLLPGFRVRSYHVRGLLHERARASVGGPLIRGRLYLMSSVQYLLEKVSTRTLPFPFNESKQERINSFLQIDFIATRRRVVNGTLHFSPDHVNFVNPGYFDPQPVSPSYSQRSYVANLADHFALAGGTLDSSFSFQGFHTVVGAQGDAEMFLTPEGNRGNYFARGRRGASRREWLEIWSPAPVQKLGTQQFQFGTSLTESEGKGRFTYRPVQILDSTGQLLQRIDFSNPGAFHLTDVEFALYGQDHWSLTSKISFDLGLRAERQRLASDLRLAPRAGVAITPFHNERTVFRAAVGQFYDHIPLNVYAFRSYPSRIVSNYAPDGTLLDPIEFTNVIGSATGPASLLVNGPRVPGAFSPRGFTWNAQVEHAFARWVRIRGAYTDERSVGLVTLHPEVLAGTGQLLMEGNGKSRFRQAEFSSRFTWKKGQQLNVSYTRSRAEGTLNGFESFLGNYPVPVIHGDVYSNLPGDTPNRFLLWGNVELPFQDLKLLPVVEYRSGFPWSALEAAQNYVGVPNKDTRFPNFLSVDGRLTRKLRIRSKYTLQLSLTGLNLTNHFNALAIHNNVADPRYGTYFGNYHRRFRIDFDVAF